MQILPILGSGANKVSISSDQSQSKAKFSEFASVLKNSKFMKNSFENSGQADAFSNMFAQVNSRMESDINTKKEDYTREDMAKQDISRENFDSSTRENITHDSTPKRQARDSYAQKDDTNDQEDINTRNNGKETSSADKENNDEVNDKQIAAQRGENNRESEEAVQEQASEKVAREKERIDSKHDSVQANKEKIDDEHREKIAKAIDMLQKMGVKREEIEKVLKSFDDVDLENIEDVEKIVMKLLQEKLENIDADKQDFSFMKNFLQDLGMDGEKVQKALDKLRAGKEQEFVKFLEKFVQDQKGGANIDVQKKDVLKLLESLDLSPKARKDIQETLNSLDKENINRKNLGKMLDMLAKKLENQNQAGTEIKDSKIFSQEFKNWLKNKGLTEQEINKLQQQIQNNSTNSSSKNSGDKNIQQALQNIQAGNREKGEEISQLKYSGKNTASQEEKAVLQQTDAGKNAGKNKASEGSFLQRVQQVKSALESGTGTNNSGSGGREREGSSAWKEMWGKVKTTSTSKGANELGAGQRIQEKANTTMQQILGKNSGSGKLSQNQEMRANVLKQVQNGLLKNLNQGGKELTMRLHPPQLGKLNVTLQVQNQEVSALIKSSSAEVAKLIHNQVAELKHVLEQQGLRVQKLEVQTQVPQDESSNNWFSQDEHNQAKDRREQREKRSMRNRWLAQGEDEDMAQSLQNSILEEKNSVSEISVIA